MLELLCFDICAFAILLTLYLSTRDKNLMAGKAGRRLAVLVYVTLIVVVLDITVSVFNSQSRKNVAVGYLLMAVYHILRNGAFYLYGSYMVALVGTWHRTGNDMIKAVRFVPCFAVGAITAAAPIFHVFYFYSASGTYITGPYYNLIYVCSGIYIIYSMYYISKNSSIIGIKKSVALTVCSAFSFISSIIQYYRPCYVVEILGFTLSVVVIVLFIDNPEDKIEDITGLMNISSYLSELKMYFFTNKEFDIIHVDIKNHRILEQVLNFDKYSAVLKNVSDSLSDLNNKMHIYGSLYYIKDGKFRVIVEESDIERTKEFAHAVCDLFNGEVAENDMDITLESAVIVSRCPYDFGTVEDLLAFRGAVEKFETTGNVGLVSDFTSKDKTGIHDSLDKYIESGILNDKFKVGYQPIYGAGEQCFVFLEAILFLYDEENGMISPEIFRSVAEKNGTINQLGSIMIEQVCDFIASDDFKELGIEIVVINLSAIQCLQENLADLIIGIVEKYNVAPSNIIFEITESIASDNQKTFENNIKKLHDYGFELVLDDYGNGYSNIITLSGMPFKAVKLSKAFVNSSTNKTQEVVLEKTLEMIRALGKHLIADGIQDGDTAEKYITYGCDYLQGGYYAGVVERDGLNEFFRYTNYGRVRPEESNQGNI